MKKVFLLGTKINDVSLDEAVQRCLGFLESGKQHVVVTPNPEMLVYGYSQKNYRRIFEGADLAIPDGSGLKVGAFLLNKKIEHTTTGVDLTKRLLREAEQQGYSVLFFGGSDDTGRPLLERLTHTFPRLHVAHVQGGKVHEDGAVEDVAVLDTITAQKPDIVFVCLGHPKQEQFINRYRNVIDARLLLGVGGTIDFLSGKSVRAPQWMSRVWLEWLYRLIREPRRGKRIFTAVVIFPLLCIWWHVRSMYIYRKNVAGLLLDDKDALIGRHIRTGYWQLPQGGMKRGETYEEAIRREMDDEIGTKHYTIIKYVPNCYSYEWPQDKRDIHGYRGQRQTVVLLQFTGNRDEIRMSPHEFTAHDWVAKDYILQDKRIPDFKKVIIEKGLAQLAI